jgi:hypothetical protein
MAMAGQMLLVEFLINVRELLDLDLDLDCACLSDVKWMGVLSRCVADAMRCAMHDEYRILGSLTLIG